MNSQKTNAKNTVRLISFPLFLFLGLLIIASIAFLGRKYTSGSSEIVAQKPEQLGQVLGVSYDPEDYRYLDSPVIYQCAFDEAPMDACKIEYPLFSTPEIDRDLLLVPDTGSITPINPVGPGGGTTCYATSNSRMNLQIDFGFSSCGDRADLWATFYNRDNLSDDAFLGHAQFAIRDEAGNKIEGYEQGGWLVPQLGHTISWSKTLDTSLQNRLLTGELIVDFIPGGSACTVTASICGTPSTVPPATPGGLNTVWKADWLGSVQIDKFRAIKYFASNQYTASDSTPDYGNTLGLSSKRLAKTVYEPLADEILTYKTSKFVPGYVTLTGGSFSAKPHYYHGNAVLVASMGPEDDSTDTKYKLPWQFITSKQVTEDLEAETTHESSYERFIEWIEEVFDFLEFDRCSGIEEINRTYKYDATTGKKTVFSIGQFYYSVYDIIFKSNLASTIGLQCEQFEKGGCLIPTDLSSCNIGNEFFEYVNGEIVFTPGREQEFVDCLLSQNIYVSHLVDEFDKFTFNAGLFILDNYWKRLQTYAEDKSICHYEQVKKKKNVGVRARYKVELFDLNVDNCEEPTVSEDCEPDPTIDCSTSYNQRATAFIPFLGEVPAGLAYLDLVLTATEEDIPDLPDCPEEDPTGLCYCDDNQVDTLTCYLLEKGIIDTEKEAALSGISIYEDSVDPYAPAEKIYPSYLEGLEAICNSLY